jgi:hypothetical protein
MSQIHGEKPCIWLFFYVFFGGGSRMNANKTIQKLQMAILQQGLAVTVSNIIALSIKFHAILQQGLAVTVSRRQFFSTKTQHFITITALNIKVLHFFKKKGEWKEQNYEIMSSASKLEIIECLLEIYKAVSG